MGAWAGRSGWWLAEGGDGDGHGDGDGERTGCRWRPGPFGRPVPRATVAFARPLRGYCQAPAKQPSTSQNPHNLSPCPSPSSCPSAQREARRLLAKRLPIPAYDHLLKLSHTFNLMDARGAVGVTERAECFAVLRGLAREITGGWFEGVGLGV